MYIHFNNVYNKLMYTHLLMYIYIYIYIYNRKLVNTILYAEDQILMATSEDDLQTVAHHLNRIA